MHSHSALLFRLAHSQPRCSSSIKIPFRVNAERATWRGQLIMVPILISQNKMKNTVTKRERKRLTGPCFDLNIWA